MAETFNWIVGKKETFNWQLPVVIGEVENTNTFVDSEGQTQFIDSETGLPFRDNGL